MDSQEQQPGQDAVEFRFPEETATVPSPEKPEDKEELPTGVLGWLRKLERSNLGFALKLSAALTLSRMAPEHALPRYQQAIVERSDERRWERVHEQHPEVAQPEVEYLSEASPDHQSEILHQRDLQYEAAIQEAVRAYTEFIGEGAGTKADMQAVQATLKNHTPSQVDRTLLDMGVPVSVDRPYPVVRFVPNVRGESTRALTRRLEKHSAAGIYDQTKDREEADTIFVELKRYDPEVALRTFRHEEVHWRLSTFEQHRKTSQLLEHTLGQERVFSEGLTELLNKEVDAAQGRDVPVHAYDPYVWAVDRVRQVIGKERFWELVKTDWTDGVRQELEHRYGMGTSWMLLSPKHGAQDIFNENPEIAYRMFRELTHRHVLQRGDVQSASDRLSLDLPLVERTFMVSPSGMPIGYVLPSPDGIDMRVDLPGMRGHYGESATPDRHLQPLSALPGVERLWHQFQPTAEALFAQQADPDSEPSVAQAEEAIRQFEAFRDSVEIELERNVRQ